MGPGEPGNGPLEAPRKSDSVRGVRVIFHLLMSAVLSSYSVLRIVMLFFFGRLYVFPYFVPSKGAQLVECGNESL